MRAKTLEVQAQPNLKMSRTVELYISKDLHAKQARVAGHELAKRNLGLLDFYAYQIERIDRLSPSNTHNPILIRETLSQANLSLKTRSKLESAEEKLVQIMNRVGLETSPERTDTNIEKVMEKIPPFLNTENAMFFLVDITKRLNFLISEECSRKLDTIRHLAYVYVESRILNMAVFRGVYLVPPKPGLVQQGLYKYSMN